MTISVPEPKVIQLTGKQGYGKYQVFSPPTSSEGRAACHLCSLSLQPQDYSLPSCPHPYHDKWVESAALQWGRVGVCVGVIHQGVVVEVQYPIVQPPLPCQSSVCTYDGVQDRCAVQSQKRSNRFAQTHTLHVDVESTKVLNKNIPRFLATERRESEPVRELATHKLVSVSVQ